MASDRSPFHPDDLERLHGPAAAFDLGGESTPRLYALQNHLALETVAYLVRHGAPISFRGGTALYTKLPERRRFSIDVDLITTDRAGVHDALREFARRFARSDVRLHEPPRDLRVEGVSHTLTFGRPGPGVRILVEVVEVRDLGTGTEPTRLQVGELDWGMVVPTPTLAAFVGQKLAVLGPRTIGKAVGRNQPHARGNQGVCKQIYDLRQLLRVPSLDPIAIEREYDIAVEEGNLLRATSHSRSECLADARNLLGCLRSPRSTGKEDEVRYGLWSGYDDSKRWILDRGDWGEDHYRIAAGVVRKLARGLEMGLLDLDAVRQPVVAQAVPEHVLERLAIAERHRVEWFQTGEFGDNARIAWAWEPE